MCDHIRQCRRGQQHSCHRPPVTPTPSTPTPTTQPPTPSPVPAPALPLQPPRLYSWSQPSRDFRSRDAQAVLLLLLQGCKIVLHLCIHDMQMHTIHLFEGGRVWVQTQNSIWKGRIGDIPTPQNKVPQHLPELEDVHLHSRQAPRWENIFLLPWSL
jgi:hypothetical protein